MLSVSVIRCCALKNLLSFLKTQPNAELQMSGEEEVYQPRKAISAEQCVLFCFPEMFAICRNVVFVPAFAPLSELKHGSATFLVFLAPNVDCELN